MNTADKKILQLFGLKWNPFGRNIPTEALFTAARLESFIWRVESLVIDGGFAAIIGDPGVGKSTTTRILADRVGKIRDVVVGQITRPQANIADFYRELGDVFGVPLAPHNRWAGAKSLRATWIHHIEASLFRPLLIFDEAQEANPDVLSE
ncbi:MAG: ATP-binding protein, partial [Pseudomonadota bacterium]